MDVESEEAVALLAIAQSLQNLGNGDASTHYGAIEALGMSIIQASENIAAALDRLTDQIALERIE